MSSNDAYIQRRAAVGMGLHESHVIAWLKHKRGVKGERSARSRAASTKKQHASGRSGSFFARYW